MHNEGLTEETVLRPQDRTVIGTRVMFKWKASSNGEIELAKSVVVAQSVCHMTDFADTDKFVPTPGVASTRMLLTEVAIANWDILRVDDVMHAQRL